MKSNHPNVTPYSEEQLNEITRLSSEGMNAEQIALLLDIDVTTFKNEVSNPYSAVQTAYKKGIVITANAIYKQEIHFARLGSPTAVKTYLKILKEQLRDAQEL